jgi:hypothetical protein
VTKDELIDFARKVWATLPPDTGKEYITNMVAERVHGQQIGNGKLQTTYNALRKLVERDFPGVRKGEPTQKKRYGRVQMQRAWFWRRTTDPDALERWVAALEVKASPYSALLEKLAGMEAEIKLLKAARD